MDKRTATFTYDVELTHWVLMHRLSREMYYEEVDELNGPMIRKWFGFATRKAAQWFKKRHGLREHKIQRLVCIKLNNRGDPLPPDSLAL